MQSCPRTLGLTILGRKWSYFVLKAARKPSSFTELSAELRFTTNRILSRELKLLKGEGLVALTGSHYCITEAGTALLHAVEPLHAWSIAHAGMKSCPQDQSCAKCYQYAAEMPSKRQQLPQYHP